jgi:hypothetical protein
MPKSSNQGAGEEEGSTGVPISGSPGLEGGGATTVKAVVEERSAWVRSGRGGRGRRGGGGVVRGADAGVPFYRVGGGVGWLGVGEEWEVAVVCHHGSAGE